MTYQLKSEGIVILSAIKKNQLNISSKKCNNNYKVPNKTVVYMHVANHVKTY